MDRMTVKEKDNVITMKDEERLIKNHDGDHRAVILKDLIKKKAEAENILRIMSDNYTGTDGSIFNDDSIEEFDRAGREVSAQTYYSFLEKKKRELERFEFLINKISNDDDFGRCEDCGERINTARLLVMPEVARCIECQREYEKIWSRGKSNPGLSSRSNWHPKWEDSDGSDYSDLSFIKSEMENISWKDFEEIEIDEKRAGEQDASGKGNPVGGA